MGDNNLPIPGAEGMNNGVFRDADVGDVKAEVPVSAANTDVQGNSVGNGGSFLSGNTFNVSLGGSNKSEKPNRFAPNLSEILGKQPSEEKTSNLQAEGFG